MKKFIIALALLLALPSVTMAAESETGEKNTEYTVYGKVYLLEWWNGDVQFDSFNWNDWKEHLGHNKENTEESQESDNSGEAKEVPAEVVETPAEVEENEASEVTKEEETEEKETVTTVSEFEQEVVRLTNQERENHGLAPLELDEELSYVARDKSKDMRDAGYFSHDSPNYGSPFDMMSSYGIDYRTAGENIAAGQRSPEEVVNGWMNSDGHRANILNDSFTHIGVGHAEGGSYGHYWTQMFITK